MGWMGWVVGSRRELLLKTFWLIKYWNRIKKLNIGSNVHLILMLLNRVGVANQTTFLQAEVRLSSA